MITPLNYCCKGPVKHSKAASANLNKSGNNFSLPFDFCLSIPQRTHHYLI